MKKHIYARLVLLSLTTALTAIGAIAAPPTPTDLQVEMLGPNKSFVYSPYVYRARVTNIGGTRAENAKVTIDIPLSANSPTPYILGRLTNVDTKCQKVNRRLECDLGRIKPGKRKVVRFTHMIPVSTRTLELSGTSTADVDSNSANDADTKTIVPKYQDNIISSTVNVINQHCTGGLALSSFYECVLAPTSVTDHPTTLNGDGTISFSVPGYTGNWSQLTNKELVFNYVAGSTTVLEFHGYAVSSTCFEGLSTFPPQPLYVSPYRVCIQ